MSVPADLRRAADSIDGIVTKALGRVALDAKRTFLDAGRRASGGDLRLSGVGRKGTRINVRYWFDKGSGGRSLTVRAIGPWQFIEGTRRGGYQIPRKPIRKRKRRVVAIGSDRITGPIHGGATHRARHAWTDTIPAAAARAEDVLLAELVKGLRW